MAVFTVVANIARWILETHRRSMLVLFPLEALGFMLTGIQSTTERNTSLGQCWSERKGPMRKQRIMVWFRSPLVERPSSFVLGKAHFLTQRV